MINSYQIAAYYRNAPSQWVGKLARFRATTPVKRAKINGLDWEYYCKGEGDRGLVLIVGSLCDGEIWFPYFEPFEKDYRILAPHLPAISSFEDIVDGIAQLCEHEGLTPDFVVGQSFGGMVAQHLLRDNKDSVKAVILANTCAPAAALREDLQKNFINGIKRQGRLARLTPWWVIKKLSLYNIIRNFPPSFDPDAARFWKVFFWEAMQTRITMSHLAAIVLNCIPNYFRSYAYRPEDLADWPGRVLIIEALKDTLMGSLERRAMAVTYPRAEKRTFRKTGHLSLHVRVEECVALWRKVFQEAENST